MSGALMDTAIAAVDKKQLVALDAPSCGHTECSDPIPYGTFTTEACRPLSKGIKSIELLFDVHLDIPSCGDAAQLGELVAKGKHADLPAAIAFKVPLPTDSKVDLLYYDLGGGQVSILKVLYLPRPVTFQAANSMCSGDAFVPVFRAGPWNIKKGIQYLLPRLGGYQVRWHTLEEKQAMSSTTSKDKWNPPNIELEEGVAFINSHAPECDARNVQTLWILINIKTDSGTPIAGWPEAKVRNMAQNKSKGLAGAISMTAFPLTTFSLKPFLSDFLLPYLYPLLLNFGVMLLGCPGVGKTPFVIIMAMALGRYHVRRSGCDGLQAGWRRAKSLDNFRHRAPVVHEALFLDDPSRAKVSIADIKSFLTSDEDGTVDSRYNDTRLVRNQVRAFASNDLPEERFESKSEASTISEQDFFSLLSDIFAGDKEKDVLAVLKRSIVFLFGNQALYLRLPSEQRNAIVHRIDMDGLHQDLLSDRDKPLYGKYKGGTFETGPTFDADVLKEERMVEEGVAHMTECENVQQYIQQVNDKLQDKLLFRHAKHLPASQGSSTGDEDSPKVFVPVPVPKIGTQPSGRRRGSFVIPDRRLRAKTSVHEDVETQIGDAEMVAPEDSQSSKPALPADLEIQAQDAEMALQEASQSPPDAEEVDFEADAEAATFMHG